MVEPKDDLKDSGRVLMRYNDGRPALLGKHVGDGEVLFLTTGVDKEWGFFATNLTFQPFIHGAITHLIERSAAGFNRVAGEPIRLDAEGSEQELPGDPAGWHEDAARQAAGRGDGTTGRDGRGHRAGPGVYTIAEEGAETGTRFAVVPDLRESETMDPLPDQQIDELLGFKPEHLTSGAEATTKAESVRNRNEWTTTRVDAVAAVRRAAKPAGRGSAARRGRGQSTESQVTKDHREAMTDRDQNRSVLVLVDRCHLCVLCASVVSR